MFRDEFKVRYTTIPFAIYRAHYAYRAKEGFPHQHREAEVISVTEGMADFYINAQHYQVNKGELLLIPPYAIHSAFVAGDSVTSYYCICFDLKLLCDEELINGLEDGTFSAACPRFSKDPEAARYVEQAFLACERQDKGWELKAVGNMSLLFGKLKQEETFVTNLQGQKERQFGKNVMDYVSTHFSEEISSRTAAEALFLDQSYFCRLFKLTFGCCFAEYMSAYRLEKAKLLLKNSRLPVSEIAFQTGFNSSSYFCKAFKERLGISPLHYRKE